MLHILPGLQLGPKPTTSPFFHWRISFFVIDIFWNLQFLNHFTLQNDVQSFTTFSQLTARLKNFLRGWLLVLGLKECLVECATLCIKSEVILISNQETTISLRQNLLGDSFLVRTKDLKQYFTICAPVFKFQVFFNDFVQNPFCKAIFNLILWK